MPDFLIPTYLSDEKCYSKQEARESRFRAKHAFSLQNRAAVKKWYLQGPNQTPDFIFQATRRFSSRSSRVSARLERASPRAASELGPPRTVREWGRPSLVDSVCTERSLLWPRLVRLLVDIICLGADVGGVSWVPAVEAARPEAVPRRDGFDGSASYLERTGCALLASNAGCAPLAFADDSPKGSRSSV